MHHITKAKLYLLFEGKGEYIIQVLIGTIQWRLGLSGFFKGVSNDCSYLRLVGIAKKMDGQYRFYFIIDFMIEDYD